MDSNEDGFQTPGESGMANVRVKYTKEGSKAYEFTDTTTDATGHYLLNEMAAGQYQLCVYPSFPDHYFLTIANAGEGLSFSDTLLDSDFVALNHCLSVTKWLLLMPVLRIKQL